MHGITVAAWPHEWQRGANDLLGANLVGEVCGKKTRNQAYRWARRPETAEAQNGPLQHVLNVCDKLMREGAAGRELALDAARIITVRLSQQGLGVRVARDAREPGPWSASLASQRLMRAVSDAIQAGVENKPPELVAAHVEYLYQLCLDFQLIYAREYAESRAAGEGVRFGPPEPARPDATDARAAEAAKGGGYWRAIFRGLWRKLTGK
ncbi:hypothetical protein ACR42D_10065 [Desulfovibrio caledoniensis]